MAQEPTVEHVVLFRIRPEADPAAVATWLSGLRSLASLPIVAHLAAVPILRCRRLSDDLPPFTHVLHSRFRTEADLAAYAVHPAHLAVVRELGVPVCEVLMAVDWVAAMDPGEIATENGCSVRVTLVKLAEDAGNADKARMVASLGRIGSSLSAVKQVSCGENFSPIRAKGYSVGSIWALSRVEELGLLDASVNMVEGAEEEESVRPLMQGVIEVDFVVSGIP